MKDFLKRMIGRQKPDEFKQRDLGLEAERFLNDKAFSRAMDNVRMGLIEKWASSPVDDHEGQHELRLMLKLLDDLVGNLKKEVSDGKYADATIKSKEEKDKRANVTEFRR